MSKFGSVSAWSAGGFQSAECVDRIEAGWFRSMHDVQARVVCVVIISDSVGELTGASIDPEPQPAAGSR